MHPIKLVSFDADQTLFDFHRVMKEALEVVCDAINAKYKLNVQSESLISARDAIADQYKGVAIDMLALRKLSFKHILSSNDIRDNHFIDHLMDLFVSIRFGKIYFYEDTLMTLEQLNRHLQLALLTNGNSYPEKAGIAHFFSTAIIGEDYHFKKPDVRIFRELIKQSGFPRNEIMHVGDSLHNDVQGANNSGISSVYLNRDQKKNTTDIHPTYEIRCLSQLCDILNLTKQNTQNIH